jgi:hypothetical protein
VAKHDKDIMLKSWSMPSMDAKSKPLKILGFSEIWFFKKLGNAQSVGGIETNYKAILRGLQKREHIIYLNQPFPLGMNPDIVICPTFSPVSYFFVWWAKWRYKCACVQHAHTTVEDMLGGFLPEFMANFAAYYLKKLYHFSNILITPSNHSRRMLQTLQIPTSPPIIPV